MATIRIDTGDGGELPDLPTELDAREPDPDETSRFQIRTIIEFLQVVPAVEPSPGAQDALNWAFSAACDAARRIFQDMNMKGVER